MRREYTAADFKRGIRGKYVAAYRRGTNVVVLDSDVAAAFRDDKSVNDALRGLMAERGGRGGVARPRRPRRRTANGRKRA